MIYPSTWKVFPCTGKHPATPHGFKDAKPYDQWPPGTFTGKNIALATGQVSSVWVLDIDVKNGAPGALSLEELEAQHGKLDTLMCRTWSGGTHYYFQYVPGIKSRAAVWPGIDVRSDGGYVIIPPSTIEGKPYSYLDVEEIGGINPAEEWLIRGVSTKTATPKFKLPLDKDGKIPQGKQDETLFKFACSLTAQGFSDEQIRAALMLALTKCTQQPDKPFTEADIKRWLDGAARYDDGKGQAEEAADQAEKARHRAEKAKDYAIKKKYIQEKSAKFERAGLIYNKQTGTLTSCQANVEILLRIKYPQQFWRDEFALADFFNKERVNDALENKLHSELEHDQRICFRREHIRNGILELCQANPKNPLREWLDSLQWDNDPRLDRLASEVFVAKNESATVLVRKWLISAVARVYEPGCKVDHMLVLIGKEGIGKSTSARILASDPYFLDHIEDLRDKDTLLKFQGHWICEFQELSAMQRAQIEQVKAFITRKVDVYRAPYGHREMVIPRMCVFVATTNDDQPIKQEGEANRRFWPVYCSDDMELDNVLLARWRDQLWAEAVVCYKGGEAFFVQDSLVLEDLKELQKGLSDATDPWDDLLEDVFKVGWFSLTDAFDKLSIEVGRRSRADAFRLGRIFKRKGFVRKQIGGGPQRGKWVWIKKEMESETPWYYGENQEMRSENV